MHRSIPGALVLALTLLSVVTVPGALAQDATPATLADHPLVGTWLVDVNVDDVSDPPARVVFAADGSVFQVNPAGAAVGVWEPTGTRTGALTVAGENRDAAGAISVGTIRATVEVAEDGASWSAQATAEYVGPDGASSGQIGPVTASGTRLTVEPMHPTVSPGP